MNTSQIKPIVNLILDWTRIAVGICLLILIAGTVARAMHIAAVAQFLPAIGTTELAYLSGAYWLVGSPKL